MSKRRYHAPRRLAAAERTREAIAAAGKRQFEEKGWAGTTIRGIAAEAGVSPKTVEAVFGTKASVLQAAVDYAIRGDVDPPGMTERPAIEEMAAAPDAGSMLRLYARHLREVNERSGGIAWAVEHAARTDPIVGELWERMNRNRLGGVRWAVRTLLEKPDAVGLDPVVAERVIWVALDWGTYRLLAGQAGMDGDEIEAWLAGYLTRMLLAAGPDAR
jgi:AcrR family transcriptional regulator